VVILTSCGKDAFAPVEAQTAGGNYRKTLEMLSEDSTFLQRNTARFYQTRALARFADCNPSGGFADIDSLEAAAGDAGKLRLKTAEIMVEAAEVIIREPDRAAEALRLIDSALARDPALGERIQKLLWNRGLEYLDLPGDAGFRCFAYSVSRDPQALNRLAGYNRIFANRYAEIQAVRAQLSPWQTAAEQYQQLWKTAPQDFADLRPFTPPEACDSLRAGWRFFLDTRNDSVRVGARAAEPPPREMPPRTIVWSR